MLRLPQIVAGTFVRAISESAKQQILRDAELEPLNPGAYSGKWGGRGKEFQCISPIDGKPLAKVAQATGAEYDECMERLEQVQRMWALYPAPKRGEIVRQIGEAFRKKKTEMGKLISLEMGKILPEGLGEVQELIDMCDYACGMSRIFGGKIIPSERPSHQIYEQWNPLGTLGLITAFNFPLAVFGWNTAIAFACGDTVMWKGAASTSLVTLAATKVVEKVLRKNDLPTSILSTMVGPAKEIGERILNDKRCPLVSFTGSTAIGRHVTDCVHKRFGSTILELGGNNAVIVNKDADLDLVLRSVLFAAVGTAGQRCTTCRRLIVHEAVYDEVLRRLTAAYKQIRIGDPLAPGTLCGPLHTKAAVKEYTDGIAEIKKQGGKVLAGGHAISGGGFFVEPTICATPADAPIVKEELFVPILHLMKFKTMNEAIAMNNSVPQGLSSSMFTRDMREVFKWMGPAGSDCGLANVNLPTNGAEIGGAFGGEKETGGGREAGSDAWKQYMRRTTCTVNFGTSLPLAQGLNFG